MKIVPLSLLKAEKRAKIAEIIKIDDSKYADDMVKVLTSRGFFVGQDIQMVKKLGNLYSVKAGTDNPFAMGEKLINMIKINADDMDVFESEKAAKQASSVLTDIKQLFAKVKKAIKKN